ncbi:hypothetical protein K8R78_06425 [bacterium]|nr:hypothetical protein [bacterium]
MKRLLLMLLIVGLTATAALEGLPEYLSMKNELQEVEAELGLLSCVFKLYHTSMVVLEDAYIGIFEMGYLYGYKESLVVLDNHYTDVLSDTQYTWASHCSTVTEEAIDIAIACFDELTNDDVTKDIDKTLVSMLENTNVLLYEKLSETQAKYDEMVKALEAISPLRSDAYVQHVINANTFYCPGLGNIRLLCVDVPTVDEDNYDIATERLRELVEGQVVTLAFDVSGSGITDGEGTILTMPVVGGVNVCQTLVAEHLAEPTSLPPKSDLTDWPPE